ncbi:hypothetical protein ES703_95790 [subsurface metagenome]
MNEPGDDGEQRSFRNGQTECLAQGLGVRLSATPIADFERSIQVRIASGVPAPVDPIDDAGKPTVLGFEPQNAVETATELWSRDLVRISGAHGRHVRAIGDPSLQKGRPAIEFHAVDRKGALRHAEWSQPFPIEDAGIGGIMDRQDAWNGAPAPSDVGRRERRGPVVHVDQIGAPSRVGVATRDLGSR